MNAYMCCVLSRVLAGKSAIGNVACGDHAGESEMLKTMRDAAKH